MEEGRPRCDAEFIAATSQQTKNGTRRQRGKEDSVQLFIRHSRRNLGSVDSVAQEGASLEAYVTKTLGVPSAALIGVNSYHRRGLPVGERPENSRSGEGLGEILPQLGGGKRLPFSR